MTTSGATTTAIEDAGRPEPTCPKRMVYGPCGGVRAGGGCEVDDRRCPFVDRPTVRWAGPEPASPGPSCAGALGSDAPLIVTDLRVRPFDVGSIASVTQRLSASADAVLVGEHHVRPDFPPAVMARLVREAGGTPWVTLTCRDRNRVVLEAELAALAEVGAPGVHCVTGDSRARSVRADATQVFDLDGTRLCGERGEAGAALCFVNHAGGSGPVAAFVAAARRRGVSMPFVPCVAVITDRESLMVLERFPGLVVDPEVRRSVLDATDGREAGITAAVDEAMRMLAIEGVVGVNLSGSATAGPEEESATIMDQVATRIRERWPVSGAAPPR